LKEKRKIKTLNFLIALLIVGTINAQTPTENIYLGPEKGRNTSSFYMFCESDSIVAVFFQKDSSFKNIRFFLQKNDFQKSKFRIRIYDIGLRDTTRYKNSKAIIEPGRDIVEENITYSTRMISFAGRWVKVDLSKYNIKVPENGFFIGIEYFPPDYTINDIDTNYHDYGIGYSLPKHYGPCIGVCKDEGEFYKQPVSYSTPNNKLTEAMGIKFITIEESPLWSRNKFCKDECDNFMIATEIKLLD